MSSHEAQEAPLARHALGERPGNIKDFSNQFVVEDRPGPHKRSCQEKETDPHRLIQRQKQVDFGKNTIAYQRYVTEVPRETRRKVVEGRVVKCIDPVTPDITLKTSKRSFDGLIKAWRRDLHKWDDPDASTEEPVPFVDVRPRASAAQDEEECSGCEGTNSSQSRGSKRSYQEAMQASPLPLAVEDQAQASPEADEAEEDAVMVQKEDAVMVADIYGTWEEEDGIEL